MYSFHVSDDYEHRCAEFGLYRRNVGYDIGNSMLENIVLYSEQERLEREEQERLEREEKIKIEFLFPIYYTIFLTPAIHEGHGCKK